MYGIKVLKVADPEGQYFAYEPPSAHNFGNEPHAGTYFFGISTS